MTLPVLNKIKIDKPPPKLAKSQTLTVMMIVKFAYFVVFPFATTFIIMQTVSTHPAPS